MAGQGWRRPRARAALRAERSVHRCSGVIRPAKSLISSGFFVARALRPRLGKLPFPCWTSRRRFAKRPALAKAFSDVRSGRIAQLVEQLTLNQRVPGSSPGAPTKEKTLFSNAFLG